MLSTSAGTGWKCDSPTHVKGYFTCVSSIIPSSRKFLLPSILYIDFHNHLVPESDFSRCKAPSLFIYFPEIFACCEFPQNRLKPLSLGMVPRCYEISDSLLPRHPEKWIFVSLSLCRTPAMKIKQCFPPWDKVIASKGEHMGNELRTAWSLCWHFSNSFCIICFQQSSQTKLSFLCFSK